MQPRYLPKEIVIFLARGSNYAATVFTEGNRNLFGAGFELCSHGIYRGK